MAEFTIIKQEPLEYKLHISDTDCEICIKEESIDVKEEPVNTQLEETCTREDLSSTVIKEEDVSYNEKINEPVNVELNDCNKIDEKKPLYECDICHEDLKTKDSLKMHMPIHGDKVYAYDGCSKGFHVKNRTKTRETEATSRHKYNRKIHECPVCQKQYIIRLKFEEHMCSHTGEKPYECDFCDKKYVSKYTLRAHLRIHVNDEPKSHKCYICHKRFLRRYALKAHAQSHSRSGPHQCNICHKRFTTKSYLKRHVERHTRVNPYICGLCDKGFENLNRLMVHMGVHARKMAIEKYNSQTGNE